MIQTAIILAAGMGTRLRDRAPSKPLCEVAGTPLIDHALERLAAAGLTRAIVVTGYEAERIEAHLAKNWVNPQPYPGAGVSSRTIPRMVLERAGHVQPGTGPASGGVQLDPGLRRGTEFVASQPTLTVETVRTRDWHEPNGVSALAAAPLVDGPALLLMCDHLVEPALYRRLAKSDPGTGLKLGIDRRLGHQWVDPLDVTCVQTAPSIEGADRIVAIGKELEPHDCYDTGVFAVGSAFFAALERLPSPSISNAVTALAAEGQAHIVDCSDLAWLDVDDAKALAWAEEWLGSSSS